MILKYFLGKFFFYSLFLFSLGKKDYREKITRIIENKAFETSAELKTYGYKTSPMRNNLLDDAVL